jgi:hypothetical protein
MPSSAGDSAYELLKKSKLQDDSTDDVEMTGEDEYTVGKIKKHRFAWVRILP